MNVNIILGAARFVRVNERIALSGEEIRLCFASAVYPLGTLAVTVSSPEGKKTYYTEGKGIDVSEHFKKAGAVEISVALVGGGTVLKEWTLERMYVKECEQSYEAIPEIERLNGDVALLKAGLAELVSVVKSNNYEV